MIVDAFASQRHYAEHLFPIWERLPEDVRGVFWSPSKDYDWGRPVLQRDRSRTVLVSSWRDGFTMGTSPLIYVEHGAGQTYVEDVGVELPPGKKVSYSTGGDLDQVVLFICPNETVAANRKATYPDTPRAVVGCPKLDRWHNAGLHSGVGNESLTGKPLVAVTFHSYLGLVPETRGAWKFYDRILPQLALDDRWDLLGHGHPRLWGVIKRRWEALGVEHTEHLSDVFDRADLLVCDNSSAMYEFASLGRPVVAVNAPWFRRNVEHGLRFWDYPPGLQCDRPEQLPATVARALTDPEPAQAIRHAAVKAAYAYTDGHASRRAADAILEVV